MRWIFVRNAVNFAVNFCKKCREMWWIIFFHRIHRFHRISYIFLPQKLMRWIFVRNAVNFAVNFVRNAVKCGELFSFTAFTAFTAFLTLVCHKSWCGEFLSEMQWILKWIFVRNAVKCGDIFILTAFTAITAFLTKIHRIYRISYKKLP